MGYCIYLIQPQQVIHGLHYKQPRKCKLVSCLYFLQSRQCAIIYIYRDWHRHRQLVKRKIIERKFFKPPQEVNLLTWSAKEQIRYLNQTFPDEWTPDRLSQSFPISREGVVRLLRSTYVPRTLADIYRHDSRVQKTVKALKPGRGAERALTGGGDQSTSLTQRLANFSGILSLPRRQTELPTPEPIESRRKPGLFASIVVDAGLMVKKLEPGISSEHLAAQTQEIRKLASGFEKKPGRATTSSRLYENSSRTGMISSDWDADETADDAGDFHDQASSRAKPPTRRSRRSVRDTSRDSVQKDKNLLQIQLEGTGRRTPDK